MFARESRIDPREVDERSAQQERGEDDDYRQRELEDDERLHPLRGHLPHGLALGCADSGDPAHLNGAKGGCKAEHHRRHERETESKREDAHVGREDQRQIGSPKDLMREKAAGPPAEQGAARPAGE